MSVKPEGVDLYNEEYLHVLEGLDPFPETEWAELLKAFVEPQSIMATKELRYRPDNFTRISTNRSSLAFTRLGSPPDTTLLSAGLGARGRCRSRRRLLLTCTPRCPALLTLLECHSLLALLSSIAHLAFSSLSQGRDLLVRIQAFITEGNREAALVPLPSHSSDCPQALLTLRTLPR